MQLQFTRQMPSSPLVKSVLILATTMTATLRQHLAFTYGVWWCTDLGEPVTQLVVENVLIDSDAVDIELTVPSNAIRTISPGIAY